MKRKPTRRQFGKTVAALGAAALTGERTPVAGQQLPRSVAATTAALTESVQARFGSFLDERQLESVQRSILRGLVAAERMKRVKLQNGDEPAFLFSAMDET